MDFEWIVKATFEDLPEKEYINPCCIGGDEILDQIKKDIASEMNIDLKQIKIYQEDWGWALEFIKDYILYILAISNMNVSKVGKTLFSAYTQATKKEKKLFFNKIVDASTELNNFSKVVLRIAEKKGFSEI